HDVYSLTGDSPLYSAPQDLYSPPQGGIAAAYEDPGAHATAIDPYGNLVTTDGTRVSVIAARDGNFYGESMNAGSVYTLAGGGAAGESNGVLATDATFADVRAMTFDHAGNLLIADRDNDAVRVVIYAQQGTFYGLSNAQLGHIYTI